MSFSNKINLEINMKRELNIKKQYAYFKIIIGKSRTNIPICNSLNPDKTQDKFISICKKEYNKSKVIIH